MMRPASPDAPSPAGTLIYLLAGPIVWGGQFTLVYGSHVVMCLAAPPGWLVDAAIIAVTVLAIAGLLAFLALQDRAATWLGLRGGGEWRRGCDRIARGIALLSIVALMWSGATALFVEACAQAR